MNQEIAICKQIYAYSILSESWSSGQSKKLFPIPEQTAHGQEVPNECLLLVLESVLMPSIAQSKACS